MSFPLNPEAPHPVPLLLWEERETDLRAVPGSRIHCAKFDFEEIFPERKEKLLEC